MVEKKISKQRSSAQAEPRYKQVEPAAKSSIKELPTHAGELIFVYHGWPEYLSPRAAEAYSGIAAGSLASYRHTGGGPRYVQLQAGSRVVYPRRELDAGLWRHLRTSTAEVPRASDDAGDAAGNSEAA